jgi:NAD(P)-dependent dehydrogenase (short-subunit alcohol dehydrogenase family)
VVPRGSGFDFRFTVGVTLIGMFDVIRNTARVMSANEPNDEGERGVIVNVASIAGTMGSPFALAASMRPMRSFSASLPGPMVSAKRPLAWP